MMLTRRLMLVALICAAMAVAISTVTAQQLFTDDPLVAGTTPIRALHITELRTRVDSLRQIAGLTSYPWTDPVLTPGVTTARAIHLQELRGALGAVGSSLGLAAPSYSEQIAVVSTIKAIHISELRAAVKAWESYIATNGTSGGSGGGADCVTAVTPSSTMFESSGGATIANISAGVNCSWYTTTQSSWIGANTSGTGSGSLTLTVNANTSTEARSGTVFVGSRKIIVTQQGDNGCPLPNGNDNLDDTEAIQCLLDQGGPVVLDADASNAYLIGPHPVTHQGLVLHHSGAILTSSSSYNYGYHAMLRATPDLHDVILRADDPNLADYVISNIWLYGDRFNRPCVLDANGKRITNASANSILGGHGFTVDDVWSDTAPCGSGMILAGSDFVIKNSWFSNNGFPEGTLGRGNAPWADGLTVLKCDNANIFDNHFVDNSDVDLILGGVRVDGAGNATGYCNVHDNSIAHYQIHGFAGLMEECFPDGDNLYGDGVFTGAAINHNSIWSNTDTLAFGIMLGRHPWGTHTCQVTSMGTVTDNSSVGAVVNLAVDGVTGGTLGQNSVSGAQGEWGFLQCKLSANYTVAHYDGATIVDETYTLRYYDDGSCSP